MDPDETLAAMREAFARIAERSSDDAVWTYRTDESNADDREAIHRCAEALDDWLSVGGWLPSDWNRNRS